VNAIVIVFSVVAVDVAFPQGAVDDPLVDVVASFFVYLLLARFHFQWLRVPFRNPIGGFVVALTDWIVRPARRIVPGVAGLDLATLLAAWLLQMLALWVLYSLKSADPGGPGAGLIPLLAVLAAFDLVRYSLYILIFAVLVQVLLSWLNPYSPVRLQRHDAASFLAPIRRFVRRSRTSTCRRSCCSCCCRSLIPRAPARSRRLVTKP
jgi:YggT family protein